MPLDLIETPVCSNCAHWQAGDVDAHHLGAPRPGECRFVVHATAFLVGQPPKLKLSSYYPPVHAKFPACSQFSE